jgi:hypothetical protein
VVSKCSYLTILPESFVLVVLQYLPGLHFKSLIFFEADPDHQQEHCDQYAYYAGADSEVLLPGVLFQGAVQLDGPADLAGLYFILL